MVDQAIEFSGELRKFTENEKIKIYSTRREAKSAVEKRNKISESIIYRYMEENDDQYIQEMDYFLNTRKRRVS